MSNSAAINYLNATIDEGISLQTFTELLSSAGEAPQHTPGVERVINQYTILGSLQNWYNPQTIKFSIRRRLIDEILHQNEVNFQISLGVLLHHTNPAIYLGANSLYGCPTFIVCDFRSIMQRITTIAEVDKAMNAGFQDMQKQLEVFTNNESGWIIKRIIRIFLNIAQ